MTLFLIPVVINILIVLCPTESLWNGSSSLPVIHSMTASSPRLCRNHFRVDPRVSLHWSRNHFLFSHETEISQSTPFKETVCFSGLTSPFAKFTCRAVIAIIIIATSISIVFYSLQRVSKSISSFVVLTGWVKLKCICNKIKLTDILWFSRMLKIRK